MTSSSSEAYGTNSPGTTGGTGVGSNTSSTTGGTTGGNVSSVTATTSGGIGGAVGTTGGGTVSSTTGTTGNTAIGTSGTTGGTGISGTTGTTGSAVTNEVKNTWGQTTGTTSNAATQENQNINGNPALIGEPMQVIRQDFNPWNTIENTQGQDVHNPINMERALEENTIGCFTREGQWQSENRSECDSDQQRHYDRIRQLVETATSEKKEDVINALRNVVPETILKTADAQPSATTPEQDAAIAQRMHDMFLQEERRIQEQQKLLESIDETRYRLSLIRDSESAKELEWFFTSNIDWLEQAKNYAVSPVRTLEEIRIVAEQTTQVIQNAATLMAQLPEPPQVSPAPPAKNIFAKVDSILEIMPEVFAMLSQENINSEQTLVAYLEAQDSRSVVAKACDADVHSCWQLRTVVDKVVAMAETLNVAIEESGKTHIRTAIEELFATRKGQ